MSGCAVAAMSALAEVYADNGTLNSEQIAKNRNLSKPLVAKILTQLAKQGMVIGTRGPGGGYRLAKDPASITIFDIVELFEGHRDPTSCPFGPGWCGVGDPCPLHDSLVEMSNSASESMKLMTLAPFLDHSKNLR